MVQWDISAVLMMEFPAVVSTVNMMTGMEEVEDGMELVEAQGLSHSRTVEITEVEGLGTDAVVLVVEQKHRMEAAATAVA